MPGQYDYIVVGAGSAGCALATRLSEDASTRVLLLEAGPDPKTEVGPEMLQNLADPVRFQFMQDSDVDWKLYSEPVPALNQRKIFLPRGKIIGGSSTFIAGMYVLGNHRDYDEWAALGNPGWRYQDVLPYFKRFENNLGSCIDPRYHGDRGPETVSDLDAHTPAGWAYLEAAENLGYHRNYDVAGARQEGAGFYQSYLKDGIRVNSENGYLTDAIRARPNLTIESYTLATAITFDEGGGRPRARGVAYEDHRGGGRIAKRADAAREVIVSCGVFESPKLLMLSGIGPRRELVLHGIKPRVDLPGVGQNLQDHIIAPVVYQYKEGTQPPNVIGYGIEGSLFTKSSSAKKKPDLQFAINHALLGPPQQPVVPIAWMVVPILVNPLSRGAVRLGGSYAGSKPRIYANFLSNKEDMRVLVLGIKLALEIALCEPFDPLRGERMFLAPEKSGSIPSDREIVQYIRATAGTLFHPAGTCQMGSNPRDRCRPAVVDAQLRVHGVERLRVVDASIMPNVTTGNTHGPTSMIAEKAADMIKGVEAAPERVRAGQCRRCDGAVR